MLEEMGMAQYHLSNVRIQLAGVVFPPGRGHQPLGPAHRAGRQQRRPFQERGRRAQPAAALRPPGRPLQLRRHVLIRARRRLGPVPGPPVRIGRRIGGRR
jgi:hypothetical protein